MLEAFKLRKPWAAVVINLLFSPVIGMLYLNRGWLALGYFFISILALIGLKAIHATVIIAALILRVIGAFHGFLIARHWVGPARWYARWYSIFILAVVLPVGALVFRDYGYEPFHVPSGSMAPTIVAGDYFFANKHAYNLTHLPQRGDVVVFINGRSGFSFVKRVIGIPGDRIQLKDGVVYINDQPLPQTRISDYNYSGKPVTQFVETLPDGKIIHIIKTALHNPADNTPVYQVPLEHYFLLGDNRDNSRDSRFNDIGFVPVKDIQGKAGDVWWNSDLHRITFRPVQ